MPEVCGLEVRTHMLGGCTLVKGMSLIALTDPGFKVV